MIHRLIDDEGVRQRIRFDNDLALLIHEDGETTASTRFAIEHMCKTIDDPDEQDGVTLVIAPWLQPGHQIIWSEGLVTVSPSILCPDCGLHGFVRNGKWENA